MKYCWHFCVCFSATHCRFSSESVSYFFSSVRRSALSFHLLCKWITRWRHRNGWMRISVRRGMSARPIARSDRQRLAERERLFSWKISRVLQFSFLATQSAFFLSTPTRQNGKREKSCSSCWTPRPLFRVVRSGHGTSSLMANCFDIIWLSSISHFFQRSVTQTHVWNFVTGDERKCHAILKNYRSNRVQLA